MIRDRNVSTGHYLAKVVLGYDLDGEVVLEDVDIGIRLYGLDKALLNLRSGVVLMVQYTEFRVSPLAVQVKPAVGILVELDPPADQFADLSGSFPDDFLYGHAVAQPVAGYHGVFDVLVEIVYFKVSDRRHTSLRKIGVGFFKFGLTYQSHSSGSGHFQGETHSGNTGTYHQIVIFVCHIAEKGETDLQQCRSFAGANLHIMSITPHRND